MFRSGAFALIAATAFCVAAPSSAFAASYLTVGGNSLCGGEGCFVGGKKSFTQTFSSAERGGSVIDVSRLQVFRDIVGSVEHTAVKVTFVLADGTEVSWGSGGSDLVEAIREAGQQSGARAGDQLVTRTFDIQPTLRVRPGWPLRVVVNKDIVLARPWQPAGR